jgi:hypothetical protein
MSIQLFDNQYRVDGGSEWVAIRTSGAGIAKMAILALLT